MFFVNRPVQVTIYRKASDCSRWLFWPLRTKSTIYRKFLYKDTGPCRTVGRYVSSSLFSSLVCGYYKCISGYYIHLTKSALPHMIHQTFSDGSETMSQCWVNVWSTSFDVDQILNQHWSKKSVYLMCGSGACTMMGLMGIIVIISSNDTGHFCNNTPLPSPTSFVYSSHLGGSVCHW